MPDAKRPDPKRRSSSAKKAPASRPGKSGDAGRAKPRAIAARRESRSAEPPPTAREDAEFVERPGDEGDGSDGGGSIRESILASAEAAAEQRFGSAARRAAILAAVICVLTLTIAGPVRTYFSQRTEMKQLQASEAQLREQISELEEQKAKLADPVFIAAQARERLGFVMPGETPYQVQLPPGAAVAPNIPAEELLEPKNNDPWYTSLWHTISDVPQGISPTAPPVPPGAPAPPPTAPGAPAPGG
ncbi:FtsB family cell division protein [Mycolicibacterium gilvum]|uniref:Septum formation initiator n=1 Tax=Mycolicibacterium gilvum TaxID=1804 RepID=A0A378ST21_9MYCO|nr:septum formation initiator family protein [Mycolicibacterium gilvum]MCV7055461.1 septum formation initiator family protein [Mycolicibacterium gilvum]STZ45238.1 septum formation initiator [Mycolicibacterium gilvum]